MSEDKKPPPGLLFGPVVREEEYFAQFKKETQEHTTGWVQVENGKDTSGQLYPDEPEYYDDCDDESDDEANCGLDRHGQCGLAGSEHCDFDCPFRDSEMFAGSEAWIRENCTCTARQPRPTDTEPPEPIMDRNCPVHGIDPDRAREDKND